LTALKVVVGSALGVEVFFEDDENQVVACVGAVAVVAVGKGRVSPVRR
jgi:hypothetical protein